MSSIQFKPDVHPALRSEQHVMGVLRSSKATRGVGSVIWKKHFWVLNDALNRLEYYKNDQAINPKGVIEARQIVSVKTESDKQNKFYYLSLKLREKKVREFRMNNVSERDMWHAAVMSLMQSIKSTDRIQSLVSVVQQRMDQTSKEVGMVLNTNMGELGNLPNELLPFCLEAVEIGLDLVRAIASTKTQGASRVDSISLVIRKAEEYFVSTGTRYDPSMKKLTISINMFLDGNGNVEFKHIDAKGALNLLSSSVWRDPSLEGWTTLDKAAKTERERIAQLLQIDDFKVTLQWSSDVEGVGSTLTSYLAKHVNATLLAQVYALLLDICRHDDSELGSPAQPVGPVASSFTNEKQVTRPSSLLGDLIPSVDCIREHVTGLGVLLDSAAIGRDEPPGLMLTHTMWQHQRLFSGFAMTSINRQRHGMPVVADVMDHLRQQLLEVVLHVRIADACQKLEDALSAALGIRDGATVNWEKLMLTLQAIGCDGFPEARLPQVMASIILPYLNRVTRFVNYLKSTDQYTQPFQTCIASLRLSFKNSTETTGAPSVFRGVFSESIIIGHGGSDTNALMMLSEADPLLVASRDIDAVVVFPVAFLASWFSGYFSHSSNIVPAPNKEATGPEEDSDDEFDEMGENVAAGRSEETRILSIRDVVNAVYDSQGHHLQYMASAEVIMLGVDSLLRAFPTVTVSKHDLARVLSHSLRRLSVLARAVDSVDFTCSEATGVLKTFCEYPASEARIGPALHATENDHSQDVTPMSPSSGGVNFQRLAKIALTELLPTDVVLSMRSRRDVLMLGLENTGKTMIQNMLRGIIRPTYPSIGVTENIIAYREWALNFKELGGRAELRKNWKQYLPLVGDVHAVVFVVDASLPSAYNDAKRFLKQTLSHKALRGLPVLLLLNNYHATPDASVIIEQLDFDNVTRKADQPHFASTCDVTILQQRSTVDAGLVTGLDWVCGALRDCCSEKDTPDLPKDCLASHPETA